MDRHLMARLDEWKASKKRKPLVLNGARQVGKTWLLKEFGATRFASVAYVNFDGNPAMASAFEAGFDIPRLLTAVQADTGVRIVEGETLLVFDEVQECPKALTSLKYFCEEAPGLHVAAAGSLLGLSIHQGTGFPVGKVNTLDVFPLSFREFLDATGNRMLRELLDEGDPVAVNSFAPRVIPLLRQYYYVGGMPEAVGAVVDGGTLSDAREVQLEILRNYRLDASKHLSPLEIERILAVWDSIPAHLSRENKKFIFGQIRDGARARDYRSAITWLAQTGLATRVRRVSKPGIPLSAYADDAAFKLFMLDLGLLGAMAGTDERSVIEGDRLFTEFKGAFAEQYACQQLVSDCGLTPYYWSAGNSRGEIDFLVHTEGGIHPIEVKAEENLRAKSLRSFAQANPGLKPLRFSLSAYRDEGWMRNVPLYAIGSTRMWEG